MLKVLLILFISCNFVSGFEVFELQEFGRRVRNLSIELFYQTERDVKGDFIMAPFTIWNLISLVAFSASAESWNQLYSVIGVSRQDGQYINSIYKHFTKSLSRKFKGASFETKYTVFYDTNLKLSRPFKRSILSSGALLKMLDFDDNVLTSTLANVNMQLPGDPKFRRMFNEADFEDSSIIVSGIVEFKADWSLPFKESNTIMREHYKGSAYMMRQRAKVFYSDIDLLGASAMKLNYGEIGDFSMLIIRPYYNVYLDTVIRNLARISLSDIFDKMYEQGLTERDIELPKFSMTSVLLLDNPFKSMGVKDVFVPEEANFSHLSASEDIYIFNFEHRAVLMVSEAGTVARAFTPADLAKGTNKSDPGTAPPFLFLIVHGPTMSIIFCGKYGE